LPHEHEVSFGFQIVDLARLFRQQFERAVGGSGLELTAGEARTLLHAARAGPIRQTDLAERMAVEPMSLSGFLDRLEARALVARATDPGDRRAKLVRITAEAAPLVARLRVIAGAVLDRASAGLGPDETVAVRRSLDLMRANLTAAGRTAASEPSP
jgi:MarR family transcriptional regulator, transcriptional regulator for hemolysin